MGNNAQLAESQGIQIESHPAGLQYLGRSVIPINTSVNWPKGEHDEYPDRVEEDLQDNADLGAALVAASAALAGMGTLIGL